ncbi:MAG: HPP family protein [Bacillota bacterium]
MPEAKKEILKHYMIPFSEYPSIKQDSTLKEAVKMMFRMSKEKGYRWLVVMDDNNNITGFLTLRNILEAISNLAPKAGGWVGIFTFNRPGFFYWKGVNLIKDTPIKKCIRPLVDVFVHETDHPSKAAELIINRRITIIPVLDVHDKVAGIVRPVDLLPFIDQLFEEPPLDQAIGGF